MYWQLAYKYIPKALQTLINHAPVFVDERLCSEEWRLRVILDSKVFALMWDLPFNSLTFTSTLESCRGLRCVSIHLNTHSRTEVQLLKLEGTESGSVSIVLPRFPIKKLRCELPSLFPATEMSSSAFQCFPPAFAPPLAVGGGSMLRPLGARMRPLSDLGEALWHLRCGDQEKSGKPTVFGGCRRLCRMSVMQHAVLLEVLQHSSRLFKTEWISL